MKTDAIQNYILKSEHNLRIAAAVENAWGDVREKLVSDFLHRLEARLKKKLKGWKFESWGGCFFADAYPGYYMWKPAWKHLSVGIQCGEYGEKMVIGVSRDTNDTRKMPLYPPLLSAVQKIHPSAKSQSWWEAQVTMRSPASDWRKPEILWRLKTDEKLLADVAEQLVQVAKVSEPIVDRMTRKG